MPLPLILGGIAVASGIAGVGTGIHGGIKMKEAKDTMKHARTKQKKAVKKFEKKNAEITELMDSVGKQELKTLSCFHEFSDIIEKIQGRPEFAAYSKNGIDLPKYEAEELKKISAGAGILLGGLGSAAAGTAGGFAAAGATTSAVMALGTASTGTAISALSGVAATNATLAALGGGTIAAGGGGMALGSTVLGGAALGIGLLAGGVIFSIAGSKLSEKADEAYAQAKRTKKEVDIIVSYFDELYSAAKKFKDTLSKVEKQYKKHLKELDYVVNCLGKTEWSEFTEKEKLMTQNAILLVGLLYKMCQVNLVLKAKKADKLNKVNHKGIDASIDNANNVLADIESAA